MSDIQKKNNKVAVTGATGTVARYLIPHLVAQGFDVVGIARRAISDELDCEKAVGELSDKKFVTDTLQGVDYVIHTAALTRSADAAELYQANEAVTKTVAEAAVAQGVSRFVFLSSDLADNPAGPYGRSKLACEEIVANAGLKDCVVLRMSPFIGGLSEQDNSTFANFIRSLKQENKMWLPAGGGFLVAPLFADDFCRLIDAVLTFEGQNGNNYSVTGEVCTLKAFLQLAAEKTHTQAKIGNVPMLPILMARTMLRLMPFIKHPVVESLAVLDRKPMPAAGCLQNDFGFAPRPVAQMLDTLKGLN